MSVPGLGYLLERLFRRPHAPVHQYAEITWAEVPLLEQLIFRLGGDPSEFREILTKGDPETVEM
jgi:hypothetical protein